MPRNVDRPVVTLKVISGSIETSWIPYFSIMARPAVCSTSPTRTVSVRSMIWGLSWPAAETAARKSIEKTMASNKHLRMRSSLELNPQSELRRPGTSGSQNTSGCSPRLSKVGRKDIVLGPALARESGATVRKEVYVIEDIEALNQRHHL